MSVTSCQTTMAAPATTLNNRTTTQSDSFASANIAAPKVTRATNAHSVYAMAAKKPPKKGEKPQSERFKEAAKEAGVDGDAFERVMDKLAPPKKPKR